MSTSSIASRGLFCRWPVALFALMVMLAGCGGSDSPPAAPTITGQPVDVSAVAGSTATMTVQVSGSVVGLQWQSSSDGGSTWANLPGATASSYTTPAVSLADNGKRYRVIVSGASASFPSSTVTLTVTPSVVAPEVTVAPAAVSVIAPAAAIFSVTASGTGLAYQWQLSTDSGATWSAIGGAQSASHDVGATSVAMNGRLYRVLVSNSAGIVTSTAALLTVTAAPLAPQITQQPADRSVIEGAAAVFTASATGTPDPTFQWQRSTDAGATWADLAGAMSASYDTGSTTLSQDGERYRLVAINSAGTAISDAARLTVTAAPQAPAIVTQPTGQSVSAPAAATFTAAASGVPSPSWQWQLSTDGGINWANVSGATTASYTTPATSPADSGRRYRAIASNASGSATTSAALLTVTSASGWQGAPVLLETVADAATPGTALAYDSTGRVIAVWSQYDGIHKIYANTYAAGAGWSARVEVSTHSDVQLSAFYPQVATDGAGNAIALWEHRSDAGAGSRNVMASRLSGGTWSTPVLVSNLASGGESYSHQIAMDASGNAVAIWYQRVSPFSPNQLFAARYVVGAGWSTPLRIDSDAMGGAGDFPKVAMGGGTAFVIAGGPGAEPGGGRLWAIRMSAAGSWDAPLLLDDAGTLDMQPQVAMNPSGEATALWKKMDNPTWSSIWSARYVAGSGWSAPVAVETDNTHRATAPRVAYEQQTGSALAIWVQFDGSVDRLTTNRYTPGTGWGTPLSINSGSIGTFGTPSLAVDAVNGHAVVAWTRSFQTWALRYTAGVGWGTPQAAPSPAADGVGYTTVAVPTCAIDGNGDAVVVWMGQQAGMSGYSVYGGRFR
jgi:hypothetical protein